MRVFTLEKCQTFNVHPIQTISTVGAGDNFNAGYIYAKYLGLQGETELIEMAQRWSRDVCRQLGNNIGDQLVKELKQPNHDYVK